MMKIIMIANIVWFGSAFYLFGLRPDKAFRYFRPDLHEGDNEVELAKFSIKFLGGMNLGFVVLCLSSLILGQVNHAIIIGCATAHGTQFAFNVPHALRGGLRGGAPWDVMKGKMLFIFILDFLFMLTNIFVLLKF